MRSAETELSVVFTCLEGRSEDGHQTLKAAHEAATQHAALAMARLRLHPGLAAAPRLTLLKVLHVTRGKRDADFVLLGGGSGLVVELLGSHFGFCC